MADTGLRFKAMFQGFAHTNAALANLQPCNCSVSTMTLCGKIDSAVDIEAVLAWMKTGCIQPWGLDVAPDSPSKRTKGPAKAFYNQLTIKAKTTSIKLFSNGSVHVTGAKSLVHFADVMDRVCAALGAMLPRQPSLESASISMINAIFCTARKLPLRVLRQAFEVAGHAASYDPDAYPGMNAKITSLCGDDSKIVTVMIFTTGNVIISGAKSPEHIANVYHIVCTVIDTLEFQRPDPPLQHCSPGLLDMYYISNGYSSRIASLCPE
jgi:TATA-box binding protein (TBP) (component of TFIID and TFIIIB)